MASKLDKLIKKNESAFYDTIVLGDNSLMFHTCCHCKSRHAFHFKIIGIETDNPGIAIDIYSDPLGTELRRFYERKRKVK